MRSQPALPPLPRSNRTAVIAGDLREPSFAKSAVDAAVSAFGRLDILVNNARATKRADFFALTEEDWQMASR
jgi:NAD(P)-dependent dehydrogenase (short-subunit alcohol dehydrogenase family)